MSTGDDRPATIAIDLQARGNARMLERVLATRHQLLPDARDRSPEVADLTIIDAGALQRRAEQIRRVRAQMAPVIVPVLLIAETRDLRDGLVQRHFGRMVDDVVRIPTTGAELHTRVDNLLRLRRLSREQHTRHQVTERALRGTTRALRALNSGNEVLVRVQQELELLDAICRIIIDEGQYPLTWIGFGSAPDNDVTPTTETDIEIRSAAGSGSAQLTGHMARTGPAGRALATGAPQTVPDLRANPTALPLGGEGPDALASALLLPIVPHTGPPGLLAIYSRFAGDFSDDERELLERLAGNLRLGVSTLRADADRERQREAIHDLAFSDPLTGLSNRAHLVERLQELLFGTAAKRRLAVLFVDLDHFKLVNDALGHAAGDEVLRQVGHRLANAVRAGDLVARQGGDEFIVVMSDAPRSGEGSQQAAAPGAFTGTARDLADHIARALREPLVVYGYERRVGASIGISIYPEHGDDAESLIDQADTAMYSAKLSGARRVAVYALSMARERRRRLSLEVRLQQALDRDELKLCYQPLVELASGRVTGAEALLRWPQADGSFIAPTEFIPVAEETGLISGVGDWVLDQAARQVARWQARSMAIPVAVNVSPQQIQTASDPRRFSDVVAAHVDPAWLELEVTEGVLMSEPEDTGRMLRAFTEQGFRLAIDDFGTGYSSLARLQDLPIQTLKIDRVFVADLGRRHSGEGIVHTIIELARSMSMQPVAEGIETDRQRQLLLASGCQLGQGYWFSQPLPADGIERLIWQDRQTRPEPRQV